MVNLNLIVVTDRRQAARPLLDVVKAALDGGARTFLLREKDLPRAQRWELAEAIRALGGFVIAGGADPLGGTAVHLSAVDAQIDSDLLTGRSCHSEAEVMAAKEDYVTLSPIFASTSKPGYGPPLGLDLLRAGVIALGGVETPDRARACRQAGAGGVAVMGAVMRASDPARVVNGLLP